MARFVFFFVGMFLGALTLYADDLGRTDRVWKEFLSETVRRGLPLLADDPNPRVIPSWPMLDRSLLEAQSLEPSADVVLLTALLWM